MDVYLAVIFGLLSMLGFGLSNAFSKPLTKKFDPSQIIFLRGITICLILFLPALFHLGDLNGQMGQVLLAFFLGVVGYIPVLAFTHGIKISRVGIVAPIASSAPLITVFLARIFLDTPISNVQWIAICLIVFSNMFISLDIRNWRNSSGLKVSSGIPYALIASVGWGLWFFFMVYPTRAIGPYLAAFFAELGVTVIAGCHVFYKFKALGIRQVKQTQIIYNGALICLGTLGYTVGISKANVAIVATLSNAPAIVSTLVGRFKFHEYLHSKEKWAISLMIFGVIVLSAAG